MYKNLTPTSASYALAPLQQGMLYHALSGGTPGVDVEQILCTLAEPLDLDRLRRAWDSVCARHDVLRTRFVWDGVASPEQVVEPESPLELTHLDWTGQARESLAARLEDVIAAERKRGFTLDQLPLMRVTVIEAGPTLWHCLWTFHHILLDGRSFPVILREVFGSYDADRDGAAFEPEPAAPYQAFISWISQRDHARSEPFWREALAGFSAPTPLPLAGLGNATSVDEVRATELRVPTDALRAFAGAHDITLNTLVQGAWALLLHHYSGERDVVFGATRACRRSVDEEVAARAVGLLINTLPVRAAVESDDRVVPWLRRLRAFNVALRDHEHTPLSDVQRWSSVPAGTPLFQTLVVFENYLLDTSLRAQAGRWSHRRFEYRGQTNFPLALIAYDDTELLLRLEYNASLVDDARAAAMLGHVRTLLAGLVAQPDAFVAAIPYTTAEERAAIAAPQTARVLRVDECIHQRFERQARERPDAVALVFEDRTTTYGELDRLANALATRLRAMGVGPEVLVGLCVERSAELVVAILGILKAGGAYVPIDPEYPADRINYILDDAGVKALVANSALLSKLPGSNRSVLLLDDRASWDVPAAAASTSAPPAPSNVAYVIYTSGSTGRPKGVLVTHANVTRLFDATRESFDFGRDDVWTLFHSSAFDFSVWEMWGALAYGGRLVVVPYLTTRSPEAFFDLLVRERVTVLNQTPSAFLQLIPVAVAADASRAIALRWVIFGGEALDPARLAPWVDRFGAGQTALVNMYGITETTVHVTFRRLTERDIRGGSRSVIGAPLADLELHVLDPYLRPAPVGVAGELFVGGAGLARGYLNRPELTAQRFIASPFSSAPGARLYRTGDLARRLPDGDVEYLGRVDDQVKIRGFRIELGEIDAAIGELPFVASQVTIMREDEPGHRRLVSYYVLKNVDDTNAKAIRDHLAARLPAHMIPAALVPLVSLPLTAHGKIDRKRLPRPADTPERGRQYVAPRNDVERTLARVWENVLGISRVGIEDNFFEIGGDSILSIQIVSRARAKGIAIQPRDLLLNPTIERLSAAGIAPATTTTAAQVSGDVALTPVQHWLFSRDLPGIGHWNQSITVRIASCDASSLEAALRRVATHHDAFRLRFEPKGGTWRQSYSPAEGALDFQIVPARAGVTHDELVRLAWTDAQAGFDLARGPLFRAVFVGDGASGGTLIVAAHHAVVDGVSWRIILEDVEACYTDLRAGREPVRPAATASLKAWSEALVTYAREDAVAAERSWWSRATSRAPRLPRDHAGENLESSVRTETHTLDSDVTAALLTGAHRTYGTRINDLLLAALVRTIRGWTGSDETYFELEGHGRESISPSVDVSQTVGWFTTIFPVRLTLPAGSELSSTIPAVKDQLRAIPRNGIGYGVLRHLASDRLTAPAHDAVPEIAFNYLGQTGQMLSASGLFSSEVAIEPSRDPAGRRSHLLEVIAEVTGGRLSVRWLYSTNVHAPATIARLATAFDAELRDIVEHCLAATARQRVPADFPLADVSADELNRLLVPYPALENLTLLSPMQDLFYGMSAADAAVGFEQWRFRLEGDVSADRLRSAWETVIARHEILRSVFVSEGLQRAHRATLRAAVLPWTFLDWRDKSDQEQHTAMESLLAADRRQSMSLSQAPLTRVTLVRLADRAFDMIWSTHHLAIDGWSWPLVLGQLNAAYSDPRNGVAGSHPADYSAYVGWLTARSGADDRAFWMESLAGLTAPTALPGLEAVARATASLSETTVRLSAETTAVLNGFTRSRGVTLAVLIQAAWALVVSRWSGSDDTLFGSTYSGRPAELPGAEEIIGPFVTNLPVRAQLVPAEPIGASVSRLHRHQAHAAHHQHSSLRQIQEWSGVPLRHRLFDTLVVVQNYVVDEAALSLGGTIAIRCLSAPESTSYPLTVVARPGPALELTVAQRHTRLGAEGLGCVAEALRSALEHIATDPDATVATIRERLDLTAARTSAAAAGSATRETTDRPATELESLMTAVLSEAFGDRRIGLYDNFFDLGAHSLLLVAIHQRLEQRLGRSFPVTDVFEFATISSLAKHLADGRAGGDETFDATRRRAEMQRERLRRNAAKHKEQTT